MENYIKCMIGTEGNQIFFHNREERPNGDLHVFYHTDRDGYFAALVILWHELVSYGVDRIHLNECDYNTDLKPMMSKIATDDLVYITDFSFSPEDMELLSSKTSNIVWIDHHLTAIQKFENTKFDNIEGLRVSSNDTPLAGCELTWLYFDNSKFQIKNNSILPGYKVSMPEIIDLIGAYDCWRYNKYKGTSNNDYYEKVLYTLYGTMDFKTAFNPKNRLESIKGGRIYQNYNELLIGDGDDIPSRVEKGKFIYEYERDSNSALIKGFGFETTLKGHRVKAINTTKRSSLIFGNDIGLYDFCVVFAYDGNREVYNYSIYGEYARTGLRASDIATHYGGGGHADAAGFSLKYNLFDKYSPLPEEDLYEAHQ